MIILIFYGRFVYKCDNETVAYFIGHFGFNPILLHDELYFPDPAHFYNYEEDELKYYGYIKDYSLYEKRNKMKTIWDYFWYISMCQIWVDVEDKDLEHAHVRGGYCEQYTHIDLLENEERTKEILDECSSYILVSKNNTDERQCLIDKEFVVELEQEFGECEYFVKDFEKMKKTRVSKS